MQSQWVCNGEIFRCLLIFGIGFKYVIENVDHQPVKKVRTYGEQFAYEPEKEDW